jgi:hypothetical protein
MTSGDIPLRQPRGNAIPDTAAPSVFTGNWCSLILGDGAVKRHLPVHNRVCAIGTSWHITLCTQYGGGHGL